MKTKFTKGEWVSDIRCGCCAVYPKASRDELEQGLHDDDENIYYKGYANVATNPELAFRSEEKIANAHLIATAPKLYEMIESDTEELKLRLTHLYKRSQEHEKLTDEIYQKESLLAEARGE